MRFASSNPATQSSTTDRRLWLHEIKVDGHRALAQVHVRNGKVVG
jgi:ATP-dependent DNA ligase